jgi:hypothetical protein
LSPPNFGVAEANEDDLYAAMDWLLAHQDTIQKKLAARHLEAGGPPDPLCYIAIYMDGRGMV